MLTKEKQLEYDVKVWRTIALIEMFLLGALSAI